MLKEFFPMLNFGGDNFSPNKLESILQIRLYKKHKKGDIKKNSSAKICEKYNHGSAEIIAPDKLSDSDKMRWMLDLLLQKLNIFYENGVDFFFLIFHFEFTSDNFIIDLEPDIWEKLGRLKIPFTFECYNIYE